MLYPNPSNSRGLKFRGFTIVAKFEVYISFPNAAILDAVFKPVEFDGFKTWIA
jgi:hypothetical protein